MALVKWNNKSSLYNDVDDWFDIITENFYSNQNLINNSWKPNFEITKNKDHFLIQGELAGLKKKDIEIEIIEDMIKISGERKTSNKNKKTMNVFSQIKHGVFQKSYKLPNNILENKIVAKMNDGILKITIPIVEPILPKSKIIKIN